MSVYVDDLNLFARGKVWFHLAADEIDELHEFAKTISLKRCWFHNRPKFPHYDVNLQQRELCIESGAIPITSREMVLWNRKRLLR